MRALLCLSVRVTQSHSLALTHWILHLFIFKIYLERYNCYNELFEYAVQANTLIVPESVRVPEPVSHRMPMVRHLVTTSMDYEQEKILTGDRSHSPHKVHAHQHLMDLTRWEKLQWKT